MNNRLIIAIFAILLTGLVFLSLLLVNPHQPYLFLSNSLSMSQTIEQVKEQHESDLLSINGVVGVGISKCEDKPCIKVYLKNESSDLKQRIPKELDGFQVDTQITETIQAQPQK